MIKEATATTFVFRRSDGAGSGGWSLGLVWHPRFQGWIPPGGHVEPDETAAEAAVRETLEEAGCRVRLLPGPTTPVPAGFPHVPVIVPWWIVEMPASADGHTPERHVHVDHVFVGLWDGQVQEPETRVRWFDERELLETPQIAEDSRLQGKELFSLIGSRSS